MWTIILNFHQATHVSLIKMRVISKVLRKRKMIVNTRDNIHTIHNIHGLLSLFTNAINLYT